MRSAFFFTLLIAHFAIAQGFSPEEAVKRMQLPEGFSARTVAAEPLIRQPLSVSFDERGRMWVLQYLQYPNPAGLKPLKQDQYLRTVWDRIPEPPPQGPKGVDRITILSNPDAQGRYQEAKDFISGLNLATGFCIGNGGVYVVQPPYLLYYPDKNHDDIPDGDPQVLLSGFGMEDTHSYANSLQWGPDGWLYGAHGSTVTAKIANPANPKEVLEFQQGIWRYHPATKRFELFAEGGGNTYGLDFDKYGRCIAGTNWGGFAMLHHVQGAYYVKGFSKHGPLHNPNTYGYFDHVPYKNFKGGHVTCGGIVYQADAYPPEFRDQYIAGNLLSNAVYWHRMSPQGSSFTATHGGDLLVSQDSWCRPVDCLVGPDGSVYVADWYDKRAAHLDPVDNWDKTNGRVYRIDYRGGKAVEPFDLSKKSAVELVTLLKHPNKWWRNEARRLLTEKKDDAATSKLFEQIHAADELLALESLWALYGQGSLSESQLINYLRHPSEHIRSWAVRLIGDECRVNSEQASALFALAEKEQSPTVLSQLACTAKRLPEANAIPILFALMKHDEVANDPHIPLLIWWGIEKYAISAPKLILAEIEKHSSDLWKRSIFRDAIAERLARRWAMADEFAACTALLASSSAKDQAIVIRGINQGREGKLLDKMPAGAADLLKANRGKIDDIEGIILGVRLADAAAYNRLLALAQNIDAPAPQRIKGIGLVGERTDAVGDAALLDIFHSSQPESVRLAALNALQRSKNPEIIELLASDFPQLTGALRQNLQAFLLSRSSTALALLKQVDAGKLEAKTFSHDQLRPLLAFKDEAIDKLLLKHWGKLGAATPGEKQARIAWLRVELGKAKGKPAHGKELFTKHCATCHTFFGEGAKIGPDLTSADRKNRDYLLTHIVDPSLYIRPEFLSHNVTTLDGRRLSGLVAEETSAAVTLVNVIEEKPVRTVIAKRDIDEMLPSPVSLMPEKLLDTLGYDDIRDLFSYLQTEPPITPVKPAAGEKKLKVLLISGSLEYKSDETLPLLQKYLESRYPIECVRAFRKTDDNLPGLEQLETCDVAIFFTRRLTIDGEQLDRVKKYVASGKPIIGIRTASHGFQKWLDMDKEVFGGNYKGHFGAGPICDVTITEKGTAHPILQGVEPFTSPGSLYKNQGIAKDATLLLNGSIPKQSEPIAWVRDIKGRRVFYTSLGHPKDFENEQFLKMLTNAIYWTTARELPRR
jgi:putative membrane-bound dehydrogenase-like protein